MMKSLLMPEASSPFCFLFSSFLSFQNFLICQPFTVIFRDSLE